jgi:hypothetical protein
LTVAGVGGGEDTGLDYAKGTKLAVVPCGGGDRSRGGGRGWGVREILKLRITRLDYFKSTLLFSFRWSLSLVQPLL